METHEYNQGPGSLKVGVLPLCGCGRPYDDLCHSKAPESNLAERHYLRNILRQPPEEKAKLEFEAPTDEGWEKSFEVYYFDDTKYKDFSSLKSFIASLLQKTRHEQGMKAGKSEAFSLVRNSINEMLEREYDGKNDDPETAAVHYAFVNTCEEILSKLSTLEGK